jgi:thioesterase domain-containing protein
MTFVPQQYEGKMLMFVASEGSVAQPAESWQPHVNGTIEIHPIESTHEMMLDAAPAARIGGALADELDKLTAEEALAS